MISSGEVKFMMMMMMVFVSRLWFLTAILLFLKRKRFFLSTNVGYEYGKNLNFFVLSLHTRFCCEPPKK